MVTRLERLELNQRDRGVPETQCSSASHSLVYIPRANHGVSDVHDVRSFHQGHLTATRKLGTPKVTR